MQNDPDTAILIPITVVLNVVGFIQCICWKIVHSTYVEMKNENTIINLETNVETAPESRVSYLRTLSLPTYDNVMSLESSKETETPPPNYNQISFLILAVRQLHENLPFGNRRN